MQRPSDPQIPSIGRLRPEAVTSVELLWRVPPPPALPSLPVPRAGVLASPVRQLPSMRDLSAIARTLAGETMLHSAIARLQGGTRKLLELADALCMWIDWPRRLVLCVAGRVSDEVREVAFQVAGSGRRTMLGSSLVEPIGPPPSRAVFALRRPLANAFTPGELAMISTFASGIAPSLERLIASDRNDPL